MRIKIGKDRNPWLTDPNTGDRAKKRKCFVQDPSLPVNKVIVKLEQSDRGQKIFTVYVQSTSGARVFSKTMIDPTQCHNAQELLYKCMVAAGAGAEHLCEMYGDRLDPDKCALEAQHALKDLCLKMAKSPEYAHLRDKSPL